MPLSSSPCSIANPQLYIARAERRHSEGRAKAEPVMSEKWRVKNLSYTVRHWRPCRQELSTFNSWPLSFDLWLIHDDNVHSTSHSKDNERRLRAGACFNLSSAKLRKKKLSEYEKILFDTLILYDTKKYAKIRIFSIIFCNFIVWLVSCFRHLKNRTKQIKTYQNKKR